MACRVAAAPRTPGNCLRSYSDVSCACSRWLATTCATGSKRHGVPHNNQNTWTEHAQLNRSANFRLRGELGMLARVRHAACHRRILATLSLGRFDSAE